MRVSRQRQGVGRAILPHAQTLLEAALFMVAPEGFVMLHHRLACSPVHAYSPRFRSRSRDFYCICLIRHRALHCKEI
jgi:hypothetical protein